MDGCKSYTICGDSLFFAPEIVAQKGYDFAADLWAFGVIAFELYEGSTPFGSGEKDEITLYKEISNFKPESLSFTDKTPQPARSFVSSLLSPSTLTRLGYSGRVLIEAHTLFEGVAWPKVGVGRGFPLDVQPSIEQGSLFVEKDLKTSTGNDFDQY